MIDKHFPATEPIDVSCRLLSGSITIHALDGLSDSRVQVTARDGRDVSPELFDITLEAGTLRVHEVRARASSLLDSLIRRASEREFELVLHVPAESRLASEVRAAEVHVTGPLERAHLSTGSGRIRMEQVTDDVRVRSGSGDIIIDRIGGNAVVKAGSAGVQIGHAQQQVTVDVGSGPVQIGSSDSSVRVRSGSGGVLVGRAGSDVDVVAGAGTITVGLPTGLNARLDVLTGSGRLRSELPVSDSVTGDGRRCTVKARTGSGDVIIQRAAEPALS